MISAIGAPGLEAGIDGTGTALWLLAGLAVLSAAVDRLLAKRDEDYARIAGDLEACPPPPLERFEPPPLDPDRPTAVLLVTGGNQFGLRALSSFWQDFRDLFPQILVLAVAPARGIENYGPALRALGLPARLQTVDAEEAEQTCLGLAERFPAVVFCAGVLVPDPPWHIRRTLPGSVCDDLRRRLRRRRLPTASLPVALEMKKAATWRPRPFPEGSGS